MSDGPHKSLPMRRHWKRLAERADKSAYSPQEVAEALPAALEQEIRDAPIEQLKATLGVSDQAPLFRAQKPEDLEFLRLAYPGSSACKSLVDCAQEALANGVSGEEACMQAIEGALDDCTKSAFRGIEEHYYRKSPDYRARFVRSRLDDARHQFSFRELAQSVYSKSEKSIQKSIPVKRDGLDEGPELR